MPAIYNPRSQCVNKVPYYSKADARAAVKRNEQRYGRRLRKYRCPHCSHWHIGNPVPAEYRQTA